MIVRHSLNTAGNITDFKLSTMKKNRLFLVNYQVTFKINLSQAIFTSHSCSNSHLSSFLRKTRMQLCSTLITTLGTIKSTEISCTNSSNISNPSEKKEKLC